MLRERWATIQGTRSDTPLLLGVRPSSVAWVNSVGILRRPGCRSHLGLRDARPRKTGPVWRRCSLGICLGSLTFSWSAYANYGLHAREGNSGCALAKQLAAWWLYPAESYADLSYPNNAVQVMPYALMSGTGCLPCMSVHSPVYVNMSTDTLWARRPRQGAKRVGV